MSCHESWFVASPQMEPPHTAERPSLDDDLGFEIVTHPVPPAPPRPASEGSSKERGKGRGKGRGKKASRRIPAAGLAKVAALLFVCAAPPALFAFRDGVVSVLPGTAALYRSAGLPVNLVGLNFAKVASHLSDENGAPTLQVSGEIVNDGRVARPVPWLRISLEGESGESLYAWSAKAAEGELPVGKSAPFRIRLTAPPASAHRVTVTFRETHPRRTAALD